jgi:hypothetical protein
MRCLAGKQATHAGSRRLPCRQRDAYIWKRLDHTGQRGGEKVSDTLLVKQIELDIFIEKIYSKKEKALI